MFTSSYLPRRRCLPALAVCAALGAAACGNTVVPLVLDQSVVEKHDLSVPDLTVARDLRTEPDLAVEMDLSMPDFELPVDFRIVRDFTPIHRDFTVLPDLTVVDLTWFPDLIIPPDLAGEDIPPMQNTFRYVMNAITLPTNAGEYAYDLNGDGISDNAFGALVPVLSGFNLDAQTNMDDAISSGNLLELAELDTTDPNRSDDPSPKSRIRAAVMKPHPDFTGNGTFSADNKVSPSTFSNAFLAATHFVALPPYQFMVSTDVTLNLYLFGTDPVPLVLRGANLQFGTGVDGLSGAPGLLMGRLRGAISLSDLNSVLVPAIGSALTAEIKAMGPSGKMISMQVDVGGCSTNGVPANAKDGAIDGCEVMQYKTLGDALQPDVALYQGGKYGPDPLNASPDSYSIGLAFTAVQATW